MSYYPDLFHLSELAEPHSLLTVGWLEGHHHFSVGDIDREIYNKLKQLFIDPWQPAVSGGCHHCSICQFDPPRGSSNLYVPYDGKIYVCPELITHYIGHHRYLPPEVFLNAVTNCPKSRSMEYKKLLLLNGGNHLLSRKT